MPLLSLSLLLISAALEVDGPALPTLDLVQARAQDLARRLAQESAAGEEEEDEEKGWEGSFTVSASKTYGNTDIVTFALGLDGVKQVEKSRYTVALASNYSEENGEVVQRRNSGRFQYDYFLTEKSYLLGQTSAESDFQAGVDLRWTLGAGYGYQFRDDERWKIAAEAGLSYFNEDFRDGTDDEYLAARLAYNWTHHPSEGWTLEQSGEVFPSLEDSDDIYARVDTRVKTSLTKAMFAQLQWIFTWDNTPASDEDGEPLERDDHILLLSVGWSF